MDDVNWLTPREIWNRMNVGSPDTVRGECRRLAQQGLVERIIRDGASYYRRHYRLR